MQLQVRDTFMTWWTKQEIRCQLSWSFPCLCGLFSVLVYTSAKGVEWYFFLQVNFKAWSVFRKCFKTPGEMKMLSTLWISIPVIRCCFFWWQGALFRVKFRWVLPRPAVLSTNVNDWLTAYCQTGNVGINWHGIIPRRKKKKERERERNLTAHFFFF